jgi:hypothetical protein
MVAEFKFGSGSGRRSGCHGRGGKLLQCLQGMYCVVQPEGSAVVGAHSLVVLHNDGR